MKTSSKHQCSKRILQNSPRGRNSKGAFSTTASPATLDQESISKTNGSAGPFNGHNQRKVISQTSLFPGPNGPWVPGFRNKITNSSSNSKLSLGAEDHFLRDLPDDISEAYGSWIKKYLDHGWDGYLMTLMFQQISGSVDSKLEEMHKEIERVYRRLINRMVRKPKSENWAWLLPKGVFYPDVPGLRPSKQSLRDVRVNDGLHFHGVVVANRWGRMKSGLEAHFREKGAEYLSDVLRRIHVEPITHDPAFVVDYAGKAIKRRRFPMDRMTDHILLLPKSLTELPDKNGHLASDPRDQAIKAIQSASNVSNEVAQEMYDAIRAGAGVR